jgi:hypothetical protein
MRSISSPRPAVALAACALALSLGAACQRRQPEPPPAPAMTQNPPPPPPPPVVDAAPPPPPRARPTFTLVHTSDLRGRISVHEAPRNLPPGVSLTPLAHRESSGGLGRRATIVDRERVFSGGVVQVDAGDFLPLATDQPRDPVAPEAKDVPRWIDLVLAGYRRLGVDAVTLGERELGQPEVLRLDPQRLAKKLAAAHVPVVLANLVDAKGKAVFPPSRLVEAGGEKIGVVGVTELSAEATAALTKAGYALTPAADAVRAAAKDLRAQGAGFVVALVHAAAGRARAAEIVAGATDVDVAVLALGHDTAGAEPPAVAGPPRLVAAGGEVAVGRLGVRRDDGRLVVVAQDDAVVPLDKSVPEQLGVGLISRVARIPTIDTQKMLVDAEKKHIQIPNRELYEIWDWGSTKMCGYCHPKAVDQWRTTEHAHAFATLVKAKRDHDPECIGCHSLGFLQEGGTRDWVMARTQFADVGCEGCHGPGAPHVRSPDSEKKNNIIRKPDPATCLGCHTPDWNVGTFDPVAAMKEVIGPGHGMPAAGAPSKSR